MPAMHYDDAAKTTTAVGIFAYFADSLWTCLGMPKGLCIRTPITRWPDLIKLYQWIFCMSKITVKSEMSHVATHLRRGVNLRLRPERSSIMQSYFSFVEYLLRHKQQLQTSPGLIRLLVKTRDLAYSVGALHVHVHDS